MSSFNSGEKNMPDLEKQITEWRNQMLAAGIKTPVPLEELENHLRDEIEQQLRLGVEAQTALETAARQIGLALDLKSEFQKIQTNQPMKHKLLTLVAVLAALAIGTGLIMPAVAKWRMPHETFGTLDVSLFLVGTALFVSGALVGARWFFKMQKV